MPKKEISMSTFEMFDALARTTDKQCMDIACEFLKNHNYRIERHKHNKYVVATPLKLMKHSFVGLVAHCDTVGHAPPTKIVNKCGVVTTEKNSILGADDRAGVTAILSIVAKGFLPQIFLTTDEEIGCQGARQLSLEYKPRNKLNVLIQIDRHGNNDYVTYDCDSSILNKWCEKFGWENEFGSFSDISELCPHWGIAGVNLSTGYYNEHSKDEMLIIPQLEHTINRVCEMIKDAPRDLIDYVAGVPYYYNYSKSKNSSILFSETTVTSSKEYDTYQCTECSNRFEWEEYDFNYNMCEDCSKFWEEELNRKEKVAAKTYDKTTRQIKVSSDARITSGP